MILHSSSSLGSLRRFSTFLTAYVSAFARFQLLDVSAHSRGRRLDDRFCFHGWQFGIPELRLKHECRRRPKVATAFLSSLSLPTLSAASVSTQYACQPHERYYISLKLLSQYIFSALCVLYVTAFNIVSARHVTSFPLPFAHIFR